MWSILLRLQRDLHDTARWCSQHSSLASVESIGASHVVQTCRTLNVKLCLRNVFNPSEVDGALQVNGVGTSISWVF